jgi:60 kDa SS-A/Ro ribonucleoprotein
MRTNTATKRAPIVTHEGARAAHITPVQQLRRSVLSCFLWENEFYEDGKAIAERIREEVAAVSPAVVSALAIEARSKFNLRHVPLYMAALLAKPNAGTSIVAETITGVIQRADEMAEFLAIYAKTWGIEPDKIKPKLSNQVRKGLAGAFRKFGPYALAKYNRDGAVKMRDVMFLAHPKPRDAEQGMHWQMLVDKTLTAPDTWEVALSGGADKRETFERLIRDGKLGYLALLRNLRNMQQAGCDTGLVESAILERAGAERVLPFRYVAAARAAPMFERALDAALCQAIDALPRLKGSTVVLVDVSGSMDFHLSAKSDLTRMDAAATLASMINAERLRVFSFSDDVKEVPPRRGMAGVDAITRSQSHGGTRLSEAVHAMNRVGYDRLIVITDEQAYGRVFGAPASDPLPNMRNYMINVASAQNGVGYGAWTHIDGFSEQVLRWITEYESAE